jgi:molybdate transport system ATP-binding protein
MKFKLEKKHSHHTSLSFGDGRDEAFISISNLNLQYQQKLVLGDFSWTILGGENWLLSGKSGSGKTSLAKAIAGIIAVDGEIKINFDSSSKLPAQVLYVESWYQFKNVEGVANFYYQQRYTSLQAKETVTVLVELLSFATENNLNTDDCSSILDALGFSSLKNSQLIELSSGEHKKLQLVKALWLKPQLLILDQPYTGLDSNSRTNLNILLNQICKEGVQLILIAIADELPSCINRFATLEDGNILTSNIAETISFSKEKEQKAIPSFLKQSPDYVSSLIAKLEQVNISYGEKQVLKNINWKVQAGEKWLLQGPNGSGKSTLLSLLNGDHPQSYANTIYLFGKKRGTGESIWDIKQHIGLISPEFHWFFDPTATVWQSIASGFYDTVGLFQTLPYSKSNQVDELVAYFGLNEERNTLLNTLPMGKQRLVLLARTIIKKPELLILDEPCQGLDEEQTADFNHFIDELCSSGMTLIYVGHFESQLPSCLKQRLVLENGEVKEISEIKSKNLTKNNLEVQKHFELTI